jgi:archaellum component FlaC
MGGGSVLELEEKVEELESVLAQLKVDIKELLVDLKELSLRGQNPMIQKPTRESVARFTS